MIRYIAFTDDGKKVHLLFCFLEGSLTYTGLQLLGELSQSYIRLEATRGACYICSRVIQPLQIRKRYGVLPHTNPREAAGRFEQREDGGKLDEQGEEGVVAK